MIYSVGAFAGLVTKAEPHLFPANIPRSDAILRVENNDFISEFISIFLNSKFGQFQTFRLRAGNAQPMLALDNIQKILIPKLRHSFQELMSEFYQKAYIFRRESVNFLIKAKTILLTSLGLNDWSATPKKCFVIGNKEIQKSMRIDAEHFQPKYNELC